MVYVHLFSSCAANMNEILIVAGANSAVNGNVGERRLCLELVARAPK